MREAKSMYIVCGDLETHENIGNNMEFMYNRLNCYVTNNVFISRLCLNRYTIETKFPLTFRMNS